MNSFLYYALIIGLAAFAIFCVIVEQRRVDRLWREFWRALSGEKDADDGEEVRRGVWLPPFRPGPDKQSKTTEKR